MDIEKNNFGKDRLVSLMCDSAQFYQKNLYSGKAELHLKYLSERKIQDTTIKGFSLGASLDYHSLPQYLLDKGYTVEECETSGACAKASNGNLIDAQGERLIFPIINYMNEVVGFGGRAVGNNNPMKYKLTCNTVIFDRSKNLYNINLVKELIQANTISSIIVVEGFMDAIFLYNAGFKNVVASMGTSLTKEQVQICKRYADNMFICYDGDFVGQKANLRGFEIAKNEGVKVRVVRLPDNLDPYGVIELCGTEGFQNCLNSATPLFKDWR
ncbi:MAG: toprim domain-containing protein [Clostridiales bacterium]|nr:toprim domain-containing protein [Clostridiales bacterium]